MIRDGACFGISTCLVLALCGAGCATKESPTGDETHFQRCKEDADCKNLGEAYRCDQDTCRLPSKGVGGAGGARASGGAGGGVPAICTLIDQTSGDLDASTIEKTLGDAGPTACELRASDYDRSCNRDADCVDVGEGNACTTICIPACSNTAINASALARYEADRDKTPIGLCPDVLCGCPCTGFPRCIRGECHLSACGAADPDGAPPG